MNELFGFRTEFLEESLQSLYKRGLVYRGTIQDIAKEAASRAQLDYDRYMTGLKRLHTSLGIWGMRRDKGLPTETFRQEIGDCVGASKKQSDDDRLAFRLFLGEELMYSGTYSPYLYAISRNQILGGLRDDGSTGSAIVEAQNKYGTLFESDPDVPPYSGSIARSWGSMSNVDLDRAPYKKFVDVAKNNTSLYVPLKTVEEIELAILLGFFPIIASTWGFTVRERDGYNVYEHRGTWYHQMYFCGVRYEPFKAFFRRNSWGDNHVMNKKGEYNGGAWQTFDSVDSELKSVRYLECFGCYDLVPEEGEDDYSGV